MAVFQNSSAAGIIVPASSAIWPDAVRFADDTRTLIVEQEAAVRAGESTDSSTDGATSTPTEFSNYMPAHTSGCGTPTLPSVGSSTGSVVAFNGSETSRVRAPDLTGRVITELNLTLPVLAPSQLLDPPRIAG